MSIALDKGARGIGRPGFIGGISPFGGYEPAESCRSSIGRNIDISGGGSDGGDESEEVQSTLKGPLDTMDALQESLQITQGISKFYRGKSKSFTSLTDALLPSSCAKDLAKPENSYSRKRKNLLASATFRDHNNSLGNDENAGLSKRPANSRRSTACHSHHESSSSSGSNSNSSGSSEEDRGHNWQLPPLHPRGNCSSPPERLSFSMRSFSSSDLEGVTSSNSSLFSQKRFHQ